MENYEKLVTTIYSEEDIGRGVATSVAGLTGLGTYLYFGDAVIAAFSAISIFPIVRIIAKAIHTKLSSRSAAKQEKADLLDQFDRFSAEEKAVLEFFVRAGGSCVSYDMVNRSTYPFPRPAVNSLLQRGILRTTMMEDCITEAFAITTESFDLAQASIDISNDP